MNQRVAIVGGGPTRKKAPFRDETWDIWAFSSKDDRLPRVTRWFEIHDLQDLKEQLKTPKRGRRSYEDYMRFMRDLDCPVYMMEAHPDIPGSVRFPARRLVRRFGRCFTSTASFLLGLAMLEGYREIGLWGVNLIGAKYVHTRPAIAYLLGLAAKQGIRLRLPKDFPLRVPEDPKFVSAQAIYAYEWRSPHAWWRKGV